MPLAIHIPGLISVSVRGSGAQQFSQLGYCRDGVYIREHIRVRPIYGDEGGGPDGIPVDYSYLGEFHEVRAELYKYDGDVLAAIAQRLPNAQKQRTHIFDPGWLMRASGDYFLLRLQSEFRHAQGAQPFIRVYQVALPLSVIEYPLGPKEMIALLEWTCLPDGQGRLFSVT